MGDIAEDLLHRLWIKRQVRKPETVLRMKVDKMH